MAKVKHAIGRHLTILEPQLVGKEYLVGGQYPLVEACYTPFAEFFPLAGITPPPAVAAWVERMLDRPSACVFRSTWPPVPTALGHPFRGIPPRSERSDGPLDRDRSAATGSWIVGVSPLGEGTLG